MRSPQKDTAFQNINFLILTFSKNRVRKKKVAFLPFLEAKRLAPVFFNRRLCQAYSNRTAFCVFFPCQIPLASELKQTLMNVIAE